MTDPRTLAQAQHIAQKILVIRDKQTNSLTKAQKPRQ